MSSFHALFSIGSVAGAALGGATAALEIGARPHLIGVGLLMRVVTLAASSGLIRARADGVRGPAFARSSRPLAGLALVAVCVLFGEGAMADWSAIYLRGTLGVAPWLATTRYTAFR